MMVNEALDLATKHHKAGRLPEAEKIYQSILQVEPDQPDATHLLGVLAYQAGNYELAVVQITKSVTSRPSFAEAHNHLGLALQALNKPQEALTSYHRAIKLQPKNSEYHRNLGITLQKLSDIEGAIASYLKAVNLKQDDAETFYLLGLCHQKIGELNQAVTYYEQALSFRANYAPAYNNLGLALYELGDLEKAINSYSKSLSIQPGYVEANNNLGAAQEALGNLHAALESYGRALTLKPDYAQAHYNTANTLRKLNKLEDSICSFERALSCRPDHAPTYNNLGLALQETGKLKEASDCYLHALALRPQYSEAWQNLRGISKVLLYTAAANNDPVSPIDIRLTPEALSSRNYAMYRLYMDSFKPHLANESYEAAIAMLPTRDDEKLKINYAGERPNSLVSLPNNIVALIHFGRSGTGLLHSLIDNHPEVSTLPSIYLRGFFSDTTWKKLSSKGWQKLTERFVEEFDVLFDATSSKPSPSLFHEDSSFLGVKEGMTRVGENRDDVLSLDRDQFCKEVLQLIHRFPEIDPRTFFLIVHTAFDKVLGTKRSKQTVFYHLHNPDDYSQLNFSRYMPQTRFVMMIREPIQCCESWIREGFKENNYNRVCYGITQMLFAIDQIVFRKHSSVGIRLEDLKEYPEATLRTFCRWLGIKEDPSLYQMTAQGKKWWGDPTSPDYSTTKSISPFDKTSTDRPVGTIFSDKDQFILRTFFYPLSVRFGYQQKNLKQFKKDLIQVKPMFLDILDCEKRMIENVGIEPDVYKKSRAYLILRASFSDRWAVLSEFNDYPYMLQPLALSR